MKPLEPLRIDPAGTHLIEASAGTGKTYTIGTLVLRLVVERGLLPERILVVTFTEAATADLKRRLRARLDQALAMCEGRAPADEVMAGLCPAAERERVAARVRRALQNFDRMAIHTIHGFCQASLKEFAFESGVAFDATTEPDPRPLVEEVVADFWALEAVRLDPLVMAHLQQEGPGLAALVRLVLSTLGHPDLEILPAELPETDVAGAFRAAYLRARDLWLARRGTVERLILQREGYHGSWFSPAIRQRSLREVDAFLGPPAPGTPLLPEGFGRLTPAKLARVTNKKVAPPEDPFFAACQELVAASELFAPVSLALQLRLIAFAHEQLPRRKLERNLQTFDDLLQRLDQALGGEGGGALAARVRERYAAVLVDEFQDTDRVQARIFERLFAGRPEPLIFVGDPKQSIYAFRGADLYAYLEAVGLAGEQVASLGTNWRSSPGLLAAVNLLFGRSEEQGQRPFVDPRIQYRPVAPHPGARDLLSTEGGSAAPLQFRFLSREGRLGKDPVLKKGWIAEHLAAMVATDLVRLLGGPTRLAGEPIRPGQVAVLVRTNEQARQIQAALAARRLPAVLVTEGTVFASPEADELARVLQAAADPGSGRALRAALATDLLGVSGDELAAIADGAQRAGQAAGEAWGERFHDLGQLWRQHGFVRMARQLLFGASAPAPIPPVVRLLGRVDGERRVTNLLQLVELLHAAAAAEHLGPAGLLVWLDRKRAAGETRVDSDQLRLESDAQAIKLVTVHKSKGLEYPVVYCPTLWDVRVDDKPPLAYQRLDEETGRAQACLDLGSDQLAASQPLARREILAEAMRLTYVALTRAEQLCICVWGGVRGFERAPLGRLLHLPGTPDDLDAVREQLRGLSDAEMLADLDALAAASAGSIAVDELPGEDDRVFQAQGPISTGFECLTPVRPLKRPWRVTSFSAIAAFGHALAPDALEGRDHDTSVVSVPAMAAPGERIPLADLVRGPRTGDCLHALLEQLDFQRAEGATLAGLVRQKQQAFGLPDGARADLELAVAAALDTRLDPDRPGLLLRGLPNRDRLNELQFLLPTRGDLAPGALAQAVGDHAGAAIPAGYADRLARLQPRSIQGFLRGFIDLIFVHRDRWYVVDYKTNHLGDTFADYGPDGLAAAMADHHYYLQYLIYTLALDRLLRYRLPDYAPGQHLGGVYYLFLRGMRPGRGPDSGVFHHRPSQELLAGVAAALGIGEAR